MCLILRRFTKTKVSTEIRFFQGFFEIVFLHKHYLLYFSSCFLHFIWKYTPIIILSKVCWKCSVEIWIIGNPLRRYSIVCSATLAMAIPLESTAARWLWAPKMSWTSFTAAASRLRFLSKIFFSSPMHWLDEKWKESENLVQLQLPLNVLSFREWPPVVSFVLRVERNSWASSNFRCTYKIFLSSNNAIYFY